MINCDHFGLCLLVSFYFFLYLLGSMDIVYGWEDNAHGKSNSLLDSWLAQSKTSPVVCPCTFAVMIVFFESCFICDATVHYLVARLASTRIYITTTLDHFIHDISPKIILHKTGNPFLTRLSINACPSSLQF
jgi:hypothetical protein